MGLWLFRTTPFWAWTLLRLVLGLTWLYFGLQKLFGWFHGPGLPASMDYFTGIAGATSLTGIVVLVIEFAGAVFLIFGFLTRFAALGVFADLIFAVSLVHVRHAAPADWFGIPGGAPIAFHVLAGTIAVLLMWKGAGLLSFDRRVAGEEPPRVSRLRI